MDREFVIERLRKHEVELRRLGISRLSLFGSVARGEHGAKSDVDLAVTLDPRARLTLFGLGGINSRMEDLLGVPVDIVTEPARRPQLRQRIERDRVDVF